uniref:Uncharacterized protein n=1 Tax=Panagrolaimus sp. JU765 TaxID=591449 RepID=A0AC34R787_9BILA
MSHLPPGPLVVGRDDTFLNATVRPDIFFGENVRTCFDWLHIVDAAKIVVGIDFVKLALELIFFVSLVGHFDVFHVTHLVWALIAIWSAVFGFYHERFFLFWPIIALKMTKCVLTSLMAFFVLFLNFIHPSGAGAGVGASEAGVAVSAGADTGVGADSGAGAAGGASDGVGGAATTSGVDSCVAGAVDEATETPEVEALLGVVTGLASFDFD